MSMPEFTAIASLYKSGNQYSMSCGSNKTTLGARIEAAESCGTACHSSCSAQCWNQEPSCWSNCLFSCTANCRVPYV
jgi:hypothetical protein